MTDEPLPPPLPPSQRLGRFMSLAMVVGTVIGSGIYLLPATLAEFGPNLLLAFVVGLGVQIVKIFGSKEGVEERDGFDVVHVGIVDEVRIDGVWCVVKYRRASVRGAVSYALRYARAALLALRGAHAAGSLTRLRNTSSRSGSRVRTSTIEKPSRWTAARTSPALHLSLR